MRILRYNAPSHHVLEDGEVRVAGGQTGRFADEDAERLLADPLIDVTDVTDAESFDENALKGYTRPELDAIAAEAGVENPEELDNKDAVIAAIRDKAPAA